MSGLRSAARCAGPSIPGRWGARRGPSNSRTRCRRANSTRTACGCARATVRASTGGRIHLNGGTIRGAGGLDAELGTPRQGAQSGHKVDAVIETPLVRPATACTSVIRVPEDWALKPSGVNAGDSFRLIFITSTTRNGHGDRHRRLQPVRAGAGECRASRDQALWRRLPGGGQHRDRACPGQRLRHRDRRSDPLAERQQGRGQLRRLLRRQLGRREEFEERERECQERIAGIRCVDPEANDNGTISGQAYLGTSESSAGAGSLNDPSLQSDEGDFGS